MTVQPIPTGFVAYPSNPPSLAETMQTAVDEINKAGTVALLSWERMSVGGKPVITEICKQIEARDLFIADVTDHNPNVLFELGYAVAMKKRIWLLHDSSTKTARDRSRRVSILDSIGHVRYTNPAK